MELKAAQAKSDIREKFSQGMGEVDPEVRPIPGGAHLMLAICVLSFAVQDATCRT